MPGLSLTHPGWAAIGLAMILAGIWMIRWANRNNMNRAIAGATAEAAANAFRKRGGAEGIREEKKKITGYGWRNALSQVVGVVGFIALVTGVMLAVLGIFYG